jgi:uncharacterized phage protein gp47/JayE
VTPIAHFNELWKRCASLSAVHAYLANHTAAALNLDELLRAEWVARVSALDLYVHELVAQRMLAIFEGTIEPTPAYLKFQISNETLRRISSATTLSQAGSAFDLEVRTQLSTITYQNPDNIADGIRLISQIELWNEIAMSLGATPGTKISNAKALRKDLSIIVERRNKIAHEGDLQPPAPRQPWSISQSDLQLVAQKIEAIVGAMDAVV